MKDISKYIIYGDLLNNEIINLTYSFYKSNIEKHSIQLQPFYFYNIKGNFYLFIGTYLNYDIDSDETIEMYLFLTEHNNEYNAVIYSCYELFCIKQITIYKKIRNLKINIKNSIYISVLNFFNNKY